MPEGWKLKLFGSGKFAHTGESGAFNWFALNFFTKFLYVKLQASYKMKMKVTNDNQFNTIITGYSFCSSVGKAVFEINYLTFKKEYLLPLNLLLWLNMQIVEPIHRGSVVGKAGGRGGGLRATRHDTRRGCNIIPHHERNCCKKIISKIKANSVRQ